ncbi:putative CdaR family transcriptional regulator [Hyphomicrobiales bacterium]|nr:putative CdaR family transcriptional regulator [Hyphomicrobiales bacterium]CAH1700486.1 putative CdaR family transcriptional regulator [Hyphomicrobiales bacterium]CAI0344336.1 PucR family transcriptional regulator, purine catabolism regulatory protein [Hyphomicrobiales bacterium]
MAHQLKISELLQFAPFKQARLICGEEGLSNPVRGVNVIEAPDVTDWVQPGDVLLTNFYSLDRLRPLDAFIEKVAARKLSALIVKTGLFVQEVPEEIVEAARRHRLPVIEIPRSVLYRTIVLCISEHLLSERLGVLERFKEISDHFLSASLANQGAFRILKSLETFIGNPVGLYDEQLQCLAGTAGSSVSLAPPEGHQEGAPYYIQTIAAPEADGRTCSRYVFSVRVGDEVRLYLTVLELNGELEDVQSIAIESAINALALDFLRQQAVIEVEKQFRFDLIGDLLGGSALPSSELHRRAGLIQWDLKRKHAVTVIGLKAPQKPPGAAASESRSLERLAQLLGNVVDNAHAQVRGGHIVLFWPTGEGREWRMQLERRFAELSALWSRTEERAILHAGIGEVAADVESLPRSYRQALDALNIGIRARFEKNLVFFHELGIYRMLCRLAPQHELRDMVPPSLQRLMAVKTRARADLIETLEAYIACSRNALETSRRLDVHPKTVLYRLDKIRAEAGIDLDDAEEMLMVQIGLKITKMLGVPEQH